MACLTMLYCSDAEDFNVADLAAATSAHLSCFYVVAYRNRWLAIVAAH